MRGARFESIPSYNDLLYLVMVFLFQVSITKVVITFSWRGRFKGLNLYLRRFVEWYFNGCCELSSHCAPLISHKINDVVFYIDLHQHMNLHLEFHISLLECCAPIRILGRVIPSWTCWKTIIWSWSYLIFKSCITSCTTSWAYLDGIMIEHGNL